MFPPDSLCAICLLCQQMMKVILNALQTASIGAQQPSSAAQTTGTGKVSPAIATTVHSTIERVFDHCQQVCSHWSTIAALTAASSPSVNMRNSSLTGCCGSDAEQHTLGLHSCFRVHACSDPLSGCACTLPNMTVIAKPEFDSS